MARLSYYNDAIEKGLRKIKDKQTREALRGEYNRAYDINKIDDVRLIWSLRLIHGRVCEAIDEQEMD